MKVLLFVILLAGCFLDKEDGQDISNANAPSKPTRNPLPSQPVILNIDNGSLENISSENASKFLVRGNCNREGVVVKIMGRKIRPKMFPKCFDGNFKAFLDLSPINTHTLEIRAIHAGKTVTAMVKNSFICPVDYIPVPKLEGYTGRDFCMAKFEAKKDASGLAVSRAAGLPWTGQTRDEQIINCKNNGPDYDLVTNDHWQTVARNIEKVPRNWGGRKIGSGLGINTGLNNVDKNMGPLPASDNLSDSCQGTGSICDKNNWHHNKRTHTLTNGEVIWDFSGNVMERLKDESHTDWATFPINEKPTITTMTSKIYKIMGCMS